MVKNRAMWKRAGCWGKKIVQLRAELFQFRWQTTICKKWRQFLPASSCEVSCGIGSFFFIHSCTPQHFGIFIYNFSFSFIFSGKTYAGKVLTPCSVSAGEKNKNHLIQFSTYLAPFGGWEFSKGSEWNFSRYREPCKSFSSLSKAPSCRCSHSVWRFFQNESINSFSRARSFLRISSF